MFSPGNLYPWTDGVQVAHVPALMKKSGYLNFWFWAIRLAVYFGVWIMLANHFHGRSVEQDRTRGRDVNDDLEHRAAPGLFAFALTFTFAAIDLVMTLLPTWYSTMWGVYFFAGGAWSFFAALILVCMLLQHAGRLRGVVNVEHYHDMGKFLFGFTVFWAYIGYSQYMLYWYANLPEETEFIRIRQFASHDGEQYGPWAWTSLALLFGHFVIPFLGLLSRHVKRNPAALAFWCVWCLAFHALDHYWLVMPNLSNATHSLDALPFRPADLLCPAGVLAILAWGFLKNAARVPLVAVGEPRLHEALAFKNF
jgi:hypothetical protein